MKYCPECSTDYQDNVDFCAKDGRGLMARNRLCSHCANSVPAEATECPHCHGSLPTSSVFHWSKEADSAQSSTLASDIKRMPKSSKLLWLVGILLSAIAGFLAGGQLQRNELMQSIQDQAHDVQVKEQKIKSLEGELAQVQQNAMANSQQLAELKSKLEENQQELVGAQQKLTGANREAERLAVAKTVSPPRAASRPIDPVTSPRVATRPADPIPPLATPAPAKLGAEPGAYEIVRATTVHEEPVNSSRVVFLIEKGTVVSVVRSNGDWLEVRSKHGNPPGFIRRNDAMLVGRAN
jgi:hypothetical protein